MVKITSESSPAVVFARHFPRTASQLPKHQGMRGEQTSYACPKGEGRGRAVDVSPALNESSRVLSDFCSVWVFYCCHTNPGASHSAGLLSQSSGGQKSKIHPQSCVPAEGFMREPVPLPFPSCRGCSFPLLRAPSAVFKTSSVASSLLHELCFYRSMLGVFLSLQRTHDYIDPGSSPHVKSQDS